MAWSAGRAASGSTPSASQREDYEVCGVGNVLVERRETDGVVTGDLLVPIQHGDAELGRAVLGEDHVDVVAYRPVLVVGPPLEDGDGVGFGEID